MTRSRSIFVGCASVLAAAACGGGSDGDAIDVAATPAARAAGVQVTEAWARPADSGATSAAYLVLANRGARADTVVGIVTDAAVSASVHETRQHEGTMHMAALPSVAVPPGGTVTLAPLGTHVMLLRLRRALRAGDTVAFAFVLASGDTVPVRAVTRAP